MGANAASVEESMELITNNDAPSPLVLVVDDDDDIRNILSYGIQNSGCRCLSAESAESALEILASSPVEVVISDVQMKGMSGLALCRKI
jgi:CheY-like chemotaxis protein